MGRTEISTTLRNRSIPRLQTIIDVLLPDRLTTQRRQDRPTDRTLSQLTHVRPPTLANHRRGAASDMARRRSRVEESSGLEDRGSSESLREGEGEVAGVASSIPQRHDRVLLLVERSWLEDESRLIDPVHMRRAGRADDASAESTVVSASEESPRLLAAAAGAS